MALGRLFEGFIEVLIGMNLIGPIADQTVAATSGNVTGAAAQITRLVPLFFAIGLLVGGVGIAVGGLQDLGII